MNRATTRILLGLALSATASCTRELPDPRTSARAAAPGDTVTHRLSIQDVLARQTPSLMAIPGVTGTGEGKAGGEPVIVVYTSHISSENRKAIPARIEGYGVDVREIGDVTAPPK
jgi:hypothetical protein